MLSYTVWVAATVIKPQIDFGAIGNLIIRSFVSPFMLTPLVCLPFFYFGNLLARGGMLSYKYKAGQLVVILLVSILVLIVSGMLPQTYIRADYQGCYLQMYAAAFAGIAVVFVPCYTFKRLTYLSYIGRYSIIVLVTHQIVMMILEPYVKHILAHYLVILALMVPTISFFKRYFPKFTAQEPLFKI